MRSRRTQTHPIANSREKCTDFTTITNHNIHPPHTHNIHPHKSMSTPRHTNIAPFTNHKFTLHLVTTSTLHNTHCPQPSTDTPPFPPFTSHNIRTSQGHKHAPFTMLTACNHHPHTTIHNTHKSQHTLFTNSRNSIHNSTHHQTDDR